MWIRKSIILLLTPLGLIVFGDVSAKSFVIDDNLLDNLS